MNPSITIKRMEPPKGVPSYPWWAYVLNHSKGQYIGEGYASEDAAPPCRHAAQQTA